MAATSELSGSRRHIHFLPPGRRAGATTASPGPKPLQTSFHLDCESARLLPTEASLGLLPSSRGCPVLQAPSAGLSSGPTLTPILQNPEEQAESSQRRLTHPPLRVLPCPSHRLWPRACVMCFLPRAGQGAGPASRAGNPALLCPSLACSGGHLCWRPGGPGAGQEQGRPGLAGQLRRGVLRLTSTGFRFPSLEAQGLEAQVSRRHPPLLWCWQ